MRRHPLLVLTLVAVACAGGGGGDPGGAPGPGDADPMVCATEGNTCADGGTCRAGVCLRTVTGRWMVRRWTEAGIAEPEPVDLTGVAIRALLETPSGHVEHLGTGHADGTFEIADVPAGRYWLATSGGPRPDTFEDRSESAAQIVTDLPGRAVTLASPGTSVTWDASGLEPWVADVSELHLFSVNSWTGSWFGMGSPVATGATAASFTDDAPPLLDGAQGDRVRAVQLSPVTAAGIQYLAAVAAADLPETFAVADGTAQTVPFALVPLVMLERTFEWDRLAFDEVFREVVCPTTPCLIDPRSLPSHTLHVGAGPWPEAVNTALPFARLESPSGRPSVLLEGLRYGRVGPASWGEVWVHSASARVELTGGNALNRPLVSVTAGALVTPGGVTRVAPTLSLPRALQVVPAPGAGFERVGATPTVTWSPPALGKPSRYELVIRAAGAADVVFVTGRTQVVVPPGVLRDNVAYFARVTAFAADGNATAVVGNFVP